MVRLLVCELGADINVKNNNDSTPFRFATENGHIEVVKLLADEGSTDINAKRAFQGGEATRW